MSCKDKINDEAMTKIMVFENLMKEYLELKHKLNTLVNVAASMGYDPKYLEGNNNDC